MAIPKISTPANADQPKPKPIVASAKEREKARVCFATLHGAFAWSDTAEGFDFWKSVVGRLRQIGDDGVLKED